MRIPVPSQVHFASEIADRWGRHWWRRTPRSRRSWLSASVFIMPTVPEKIFEICPRWFQKIFWKFLIFEMSLSWFQSYFLPLSSAIKRISCCAVGWKASAAGSASASILKQSACRVANFGKFLLSWASWADQNFSWAELSWAGGCIFLPELSWAGEPAHLS